MACVFFDFIPLGCAALLGYAGNRFGSRADQLSDSRVETGSAGSLELGLWRINIALCCSSWILAGVSVIIFALLIFSCTLQAFNATDSAVKTLKSLM